MAEEIFMVGQQAEIKGDLKHAMRCFPRQKGT
jgi:hypothetical protein